MEMNRLLELITTCDLCKSHNVRSVSYLSFFTKAENDFTYAAHPIDGDAIYAVDDTSDEFDRDLCGCCGEVV